MKVRIHLRTLAIFSVLLSLFGVAIPIISLCTGEKGREWYVVALFAGTIGMLVHGVLGSFDRRLSALEARQDTSADNEV